MLNVWLLWPHVLDPKPPQLELFMQGRMEIVPVQSQIEVPIPISPPEPHFPTHQFTPLHEKLWLEHMAVQVEKASVICLAVVATLQLKEDPAASSVIDVVSLPTKEAWKVSIDEQ